MSASFVTKMAWRDSRSSRRRLLLCGIWDSSVNQPMSQAMTLGRLDSWVVKPWEPAEEYLYLPVTEFFVLLSLVRRAGTVTVLEGIRRRAGRWIGGAASGTRPR